jgi:hypothetical protein
MNLLLSLIGLWSAGVLIGYALGMWNGARITNRVWAQAMDNFTPNLKGD